MLKHLKVIPFSHVEAYMGQQCNSLMPAILCRDRVQTTKCGVTSTVFAHTLYVSDVI